MKRNNSLMACQSANMVPDELISGVAAPAPKSSHDSAKLDAYLMQN